MNDTSPEIAAMVRRRYAAMSPAERLMIGVGMFETARILALASFPPDLLVIENRRRLCERFYGKQLAVAAYGKGTETPR